MRFAALGRTHWLLESVRRCRVRHELVLVGTAAAEPEYRADAGDFQAIAADAGCPFFATTVLDEGHADRLSDSGAEIVISVNWPTLVRGSMLEACAQGIVNAHAGDLPRFRGNACPNWAILSGEPHVGLVLHRMVEALDAGPVLLRRKLPLTDRTYIGDVYAFLDDAIPAMFAELLDRMDEGTIVAMPQSADPTLSLRCFPRIPADGEIDWSQPAEVVVRLVRASAEPFAGAFTFHEGERLTIWRARAEPLAGPWLGVPGQVIERRQVAGEVAVLAANGAVILEVVSSGSDERVRAADVLRSTRTRLGPDRMRGESETRARSARLGAQLARDDDSRGVSLAE